MITLWLDDIRPAPPRFSHWVKSAHDAIALLRTGNVAEVSLDYDLHFGDNVNRDDVGTGGDVARWIAKAAYSGRLGPITWTVHSANPTGASTMRKSLRIAEQAWQRLPVKRNPIPKMAALMSLRQAREMTQWQIENQESYVGKHSVPGYLLNMRYIIDTAIQSLEEPSPLQSHEEARELGRLSFVAPPIP